MIPKSGNTMDEFTFEEQQSKTYHMVKDKVDGYCDELEAVRQAILKILGTERYENIIYSWDYGIELTDLFGEPITYTVPELKRRISEALLQDSRIQSVDAFSYVVKNGNISAAFTVHTVFGEIEGEIEVNI